MFNLFRRRDTAVRWMVGIILGMVSLAMLVYLIPQSGTGDTAGDTAVVAQIGSDKITAQEINKTIRRMTQNRQLPPELLSIYAPQVIEQAINERVMAWKAAEMGMKVSSDDAENAIVDSAPPNYVKDGKVDPAFFPRRQCCAQQDGSTLWRSQGIHHPATPDRASGTDYRGRRRCFQPGTGKGIPAAQR